MASRKFSQFSSVDESTLLTTDYNGAYVLPGAATPSDRNRRMSYIEQLKGVPRAIRGTTGGSANAYTLSLPRFDASLEDGMFFLLEANHDNTGAATLVITPASGTPYASKAIKTNRNEALSGGEIISGGRYWVAYDSGNDAYMLINSGDPASSTPIEITGDVTISKSGNYWYSGAGGHTITLANGLKYVSIFADGADVSVSGTMTAGFAGAVFQYNPALVFKWTGAKYIF